MQRILYLPNSYSQQRQFEKPANIYPVRMAMEAEWYRKQGYEVLWFNSKYGWVNMGNSEHTVITNPEGLPFLSLPHPDRIFTRAKEYTSGNYKYLPGTHIMSASGCWHGQCTFCVEKGKPYEVRPVEDVIDEIKECQKLGFKEVFDDSATFPIGDWLDEFLDRFIIESFRSSIRFGCNMRICDIDYKRLSLAGFRMLLFGLESGNQITLDRINKGVKVEDVKYIIKASRAGLEPHIAVMFGFPWESDRDALETLKLVWWLLKKGYAKTAQASLYSPMGKPTQQCYVRRIYKVAWSPEFWFNQIKDIHNVDDLKYLWRKIKEGINNWF